MAWINGRFIDEAKAKISIFDRGFMYGDGIFETMRSYAGVVFKIDRHLKRFFDGLRIARIKPSYATKGYLKGIIYEILRKNRLKSAYIRLSMTRGEGRFQLESSNRFKPNIVLVAKEFGEYPDWMYSNGISAKVVGLRQNEGSALAGIKSLNFLNNILSRLEAKEGGFDDAILLNTKGHVAEGVTANIFIVKGDRLSTPSLESGALPGITRGVVIETARRLGINVKEAIIRRRELRDADEVFFTNSLVEVLPVVKIDSRKIGKGKVGDMTKLIRIAYQKEVIRGTLF